MNTGQDKMPAWRAGRYGDFNEVLVLESCAPPIRRSDQTLIRVDAIGLNFLDVLAIAGKYQEKKPLPFIPGVEAAGEVVETGPESPFKAGDRVMTVAEAACAAFMIARPENTFIPQVMDITAGRGADVVFDPVGGPVFDDSTRCIAFEGRIVTIGYASGRIPSIAVNRILLKNMDVIGLYWGNYTHFDPYRISETQSALYELWQGGNIRPVIYRQFPFEDYPKALSALTERKSYGKIVLRGPER